MGYLKTNSYLLVLINFIRWILKFLLPGNFCWVVVWVIFHGLMSCVCWLLLLHIPRCNILKRVPNSALWLLRFPAAGEMRVRARKLAIILFFLIIWNLINSLLVVSMAYLLLLSRCCCTGCAAWPNHFHGCSYETRAHQTQFIGRPFPWYVCVEYFVLLNKTLWISCSIMTFFRS